MAVPDLGGHRQPDRHPRVRPVRRQDAAAHQAGRGSYDFYVGERITGFTSHWNTYSAEEMFALIMIGAFCFSPAARASGPGSG